MRFIEGATSASTGAQADEEHWLADEQTSQSGASLNEGPDGPDPEVATLDENVPSDEQHPNERQDRSDAADNESDIQPMDTTAGSSPQRANQNITRNDEPSEQSATSSQDRSNLPRFVRCFLFLIHRLLVMVSTLSIQR